MDYLNPKKQARHRAILFSGYILIAIAITVSAIILLYQAYGFGIGKNGQVVQNGLVYFSSQPNPAAIAINKAANSATNTRLSLPSGIYSVVLSRSGYYNWQRTIELDGGSVEHFDYPFLFPKTLTTTKLQTYSTPPQLSTQSPDRRWLVVAKTSPLTDFDVYDLSNPTKLTPQAISLPDTLLTKATSQESWQLAGWADDNVHLLLQHKYDGKTEYIMLNRTNPDQSVNLSTKLGFSTAQISLRNKKFDQYYIYDPATGLVQSASLNSSDKLDVADHVLAFQSYGANTLLYVTPSSSPTKVEVKMLVGTTSTTIRSLPLSPSYVLDLTQYSGIMYVALGAAAQGKVYIYKDPLGQLAQLPNQAVVPSQVLLVAQPNYLSFSDNAQFIVTENANAFGVYDIQNGKGYSYQAASAPDSPMPHAEWMDGDRLDYVSGGKLTIFDYDHTNVHSLVAASGQYVPVFAPDYKYVYSLSPGSSGQFDLNQTWLLAPADR